MGEKGLESLQVWQRSLALAMNVCKTVLPSLPGEERYALSSQLRRSAQSIPANIAEGFGRYYYQDTIRFCYIARGSLEETYSHLALAFKLGYLSEPTFKALAKEIQEIRQMISGYISFLKQSKRGVGEPGAPHAIREPDPQEDEYLLPDLPDP